MSDVEKKEKGKGGSGDKNIPKVTWDESKMSSVYANVSNVASTREEVTLLFGTNQTWHAEPGQKEFTIELTNRVILNPFAAKRLSLLLNKVLKDHEGRFGEIAVGAEQKPK